MRPIRLAFVVPASALLPFAFVALALSGCAASESGSDDVSTESATEASAEASGETAHVLEEIAPGVYFASSEGKGEMLLMSNAMVIVNDEDVVVVDSHTSAASGRSLINAVRTVSDLPIRYLVNTHYHWDHAHGNQAFAEHEHLDIVGHEYTREKLSGDVLSEATYQSMATAEAMQGQLAAVESRLEGADEEARPALEAQAAMIRRHIGDIPEVVPTPPSVTLNDRMSIFRGDREIQLLHLGRGHTAGDVVIYLPNEKLAFTGDLFYAGAPYLGDGFVDEFPETLDRLAELDLELIVPGHGPLVRDKAQIQVTQDYLRQYWDQVSASHAAGLSVEEAVAALDFTGWEEFAAFNINTPGVLELEVEQMYRRIEAR